MRKTIAGLLCLVLAPAPALASINETASLLNAIPTIRDIHSFLELNPSPGVEVNLEVVVPQGMSNAEISGDCNDDGYQVSLGLAYSNTWNITFKYDSEPAGDEDKATWLWLDNPLFCGFMKVSKETIVNWYGGEYGFYIKDFRAEDFGGAFNVVDMGQLYVQGGILSGNSSQLGGGQVNVEDEGKVQFTGSWFVDGSTQGDGGALRSAGKTYVTLKNTVVSGNDALGLGGGAFFGNWTYYKIFNTDFTGNTSKLDGGGWAAVDESWGWTFETNLIDNRSDRGGGGISQKGTATLTANVGLLATNLGVLGGGGYYATQQARLRGTNLRFKKNTSGTGFGNQVEVATDAADAPDLPALWPSPYPSDTVLDVFTYEGQGNHVDNSSGRVTHMNGTVEGNSTPDRFTSTGNLRNLATILFPSNDSSNLQSSNPGKSTTEANCNDFGTGAITSLGYNISSDNSCALTQPSDLPGTDPMLVEREDGFPAPAMGSPAIDSGLVDVMTLDNDELARLPCGYRDVSGTARPQDANGDGVFECDRGAIEVPGIGAIEPGHSAAYFNLERDGEGIFVEVLDENTAVVYAFSYKPDGTGASWFIGVCTIKGNGIVCDNLLYPTGAKFGEAFNTNDIQLNVAGGMSVVLPDCAAAAPGGNVAFSGQPVLGFEGLITRATRLTKVTGCGTATPSDKAGLSGAYFDLERNGEGIVVQWLDNGTVLVVFWTYTPDGEQIWMIGIGTPDGNMVTMDALYPVGFTSWGRGFDASEVVLEKWGTFKLTWTACGDADASAPASAKVTFETTAMAPGYTSATRNYDRLTGLAGTTCPAL